MADIFGVPVTPDTPIPHGNTVANYHVDVFSKMNNPVGLPGRRDGHAVNPYAPMDFRALDGPGISDFAGSPVLAAVKAFRARAQSGIGQNEAPTAGSMILFAGILAVTGFLSYSAGKAMAPSGSDTKRERIWGWVGVPVGLFTGVVGLGIMGAVSNYKEKR